MKKEEKTTKAKKRKPAKKRPVKSIKETQGIEETIETKGLRLAWIKFIDAYVANGGNGQEAYKVAYPDVLNDETAKANASRLLTNANVRDELNNKLEAQKVTEDFIVQGLMDIATTYRGAKTIFAAVKSLEVLAKMKGLLVDTKKIAFTGDNPAVFVAPYSDTEAKKIDEITKASRIVE